MRNQLFWCPLSFDKLTRANRMHCAAVMFYTSLDLYKNWRYWRHYENNLLHGLDSITLKHRMYSHLQWGKEVWWKDNVSHTMIRYINHGYQLYPLEGLRQKQLKERDRKGRQRVRILESKVRNSRGVCTYRPALFFYSANVSVEQVRCIKLHMT